MRLHCHGDLASTIDCRHSRVALNHALGGRHLGAVGQVALALRPLAILADALVTRTQEFADRLRFAS